MTRMLMEVRTRNRPARRSHVVGEKGPGQGGEHGREDIDADLVAGAVDAEGGGGGSSLWMAIRVLPKGERTTARLATTTRRTANQTR